MAEIKLKGEAIHTKGNLPKEGEKLSNFSLVGTDLSAVKPEHFHGKKTIFNIYPSIDTGICAMSTTKFNKAAADLEDVNIVCVSKDLPFAFSRYCGAEGIDKLQCFSDFKEGSFAAATSSEITDGPLAGLLSRAIIVTNEDGVITYTEQVPEITQEPDYDKALAAVK